MLSVSECESNMTSISTQTMKIVYARRRFNALFLRVQKSVSLGEIVELFMWFFPCFDFWNNRGLKKTFLFKWTKCPGITRSSLQSCFGSWEVKGLIRFFSCKIVANWALDTVVTYIAYKECGSFKKQLKQFLEATKTFYLKEL